MKKKTTLKKFYDEIFEAAPIGMAIATLDGVLLKVNVEFCNTTGYSADELINKEFTWFTHTDDLTKNLKRNKEVIEGKIPSHQMEKRYFHKNGNIIHIILKVTSLKDDNGVSEFLLAQIVDITERVKFAEQKERNEIYFRQVFDKAPIGIALIDLNLNFLRTNDALCQLLKYSKEELLKLSIKDISHPDDFSINIEKDSDLISGKEDSFTMEKRYIRKDGKVMEGLLKVSIIRDKEDGNDQMIGQIVDISQLKSYERLLQKNIEELEKVNNEIDNFVYHASHDLKGPLASIKGLLNLYQIGEAPDKLFERLVPSLDKLENIINILSDFSENTSQPGDKEEINIKSYLDTIIKNYVPLAKRKKVKIINEHGPVDNVSLDLQRLQIIIKHLLINAIQYHDKKENGYVIIRSYKKKDNLKLVVEDNGPGIEEEVKGRIFEMYYRGDERSKGSGMGLYIVKDAIAKMKGKIRLISIPGEGTQFILSLPI